MPTKIRQLQRIVAEYRRDGQEWPATAREIGKWAVATGRYDLTGPTLERRCARELAQAMGLASALTGIPIFVPAFVSIDE